MPAKHLDEVGRETFLVVPAYNEARVIGDVVRGLLTTFPNVVVVNDGSSDDTAAILKDLPVTVVTHYINLGQGAALQTGIKHALSAARATSLPSMRTASTGSKTRWRRCTCSVKGAATSSADPDSSERRATSRAPARSS